MALVRNRPLLPDVVRSELRRAIIGGEFPAGSRVLYAHLGGAPALSAYAGLFANG